MVKGPEQAFFQRYINGQQAHEKVLNSLLTREMQIKTTVRYHLMPVKMPDFTYMWNLKNK